MDVKTEKKKNANNDIACDFKLGPAKGEQIEFQLTENEGQSENEQRIREKSRDDLNAEQRRSRFFDICRKDIREKNGRDCNSIFEPDKPSDDRRKEDKERNEKTEIGFFVRKPYEEHHHDKDCNRQPHKITGRAISGCIDQLHDLRNSEKEQEGKEACKKKDTKASDFSF